MIIDISRYKSFEDAIRAQQGVAIEPAGAFKACGGLPARSHSGRGIRMDNHRPPCRCSAAAHKQSQSRDAS